MCESARCYDIQAEGLIHSGITDLLLLLEGQILTEVKGNKSAIHTHLQRM